MKAPQNIFPVIASIFFMAFITNMSGQAIQTEDTNEIQMNSTTGTPHVLITEDDTSAGGSTRIEMRNVNNATDRFEIRSFLHPATDHRIGWSYNNVFRVAWNEDKDGFGIGTMFPVEKLEVEGAIKLGNTTSNNIGTIRFDGSDFEGYDGSEWKSLTNTPGFWTSTNDGIKFENNGLTFAYLQSTDNSLMGYRFLDNAGSVIGSVAMGSTSNDLILSATGNLDNNLVVDGQTSQVGINTDDPDARLHVLSNSSGTNSTILIEENDDDDYGRLFFKNSFNQNDKWALSGRTGTTQDHIIGIYYNGLPRLFYNETDQEMVVEDNFKLTDTGDNPDLEVEVTGNGTGEIKLTQPGVAFGGISMSLDAGSDIASISTSEGSNSGMTMSTGNSTPNFAFGTTPSANHKVQINVNSTGGSTPKAHLNLRENNNGDYSRLQFSQFGINEYWHIAAKSAPVASGNSNMNFYFWDDVASSGSNILSLDGDEKLVGINTGSPQYTLDIRHEVGNPGPSNPNGIQLENTGGAGQNWQIYVNNGTGSLLLYENETFMGQFLDTDGTYANVSDKKLKKNIQTLENQLDLVMKLRPSSYRFIANDKSLSYGFIAQEVEKIYPEIVVDMIDDKTGEITKGIAYTKFVPVLVAGMQEQQEMINTLQQQNNELESKLEALMDAHQVLMKKIEKK